MWETWNRQKGKITGGLAGLVIALLVVFAWPILLTLFLVVVGIFLGGIFDAGNRIGDFLDQFLPSTEKEKRKKKDETHQD